MKDVRRIVTVSCREYYHIKEDYTEEDYLNACKVFKDNNYSNDLTRLIKGFNIFVSEFDYQMYLSLKSRIQTQKDKQEELQRNKLACNLYF